MKKICAIVLAAVLMIFTVVPAFAAISPMPEVEYDVVIENTEGGKGSYTTELVEDKKHAILVAHPKDGYKFSHWIIDGKYTIVEGSLTDEEILIYLGSDVEATPIFIKDGTQSTGPADQDHGSTSPQTGDSGFNPILIVSGLLVAIFGVVAIKKRVYSK